MSIEPIPPCSGKNEYPVILDHAPILNPELSLHLGQAIEERKHLSALEEQGIRAYLIAFVCRPTRS